MTRKAFSPFKTLTPSKQALKVESEESWTYEELHRISNSYANKLKELGVKKGDRVGVLFYNCLQYFGIYFAVAKLGAVAVRLNFRLASQEFEYLLNDSGAKILCFHSDLAEEIEGIRDSVSIEHYICLENIEHPIPSWSKSWDILASGSDSDIEEPANLKMSDPVMLMYTSGTTGRPKGAIWSHENTLWFSMMQALKWNYTGNEVAMTTGPLYHVGAMEDVALPALLMGGTVIITKSKGFDIERVLKVMEKEQVSDCFLFPFMIYEMLHLTNLNELDLSQLRRIYTGGDALMPWAVEQFKEILPHVGVIQVYGLTEGTPIAACLDPSDISTKGHTVGKVMPLTEIRIANDEGESVGIGEVGEILIKSPAVSSGYWNKPEATAATFVNGWCKTGDLGKIDKEGYLSIYGRKKDMIRSGGENIYATEIEDILIRHKEIKDVAIIGIPDLKFIEVVCAVIVKKEDSSLGADEVIEYCTAQLANYKKPRKVVFVNELPRTPSGKIKKFLLRDHISNKKK